MSLLKMIEEKLRENDPKEVAEFIMHAAQPFIYIYQDGNVILSDGEPNPLHHDYVFKVSLECLPEVYRISFKKFEKRV